MFQLDSRGLLRLPRSARVALIGTLAAGLLVGIGTIGYYLWGGRGQNAVVYNDAILLGLSIVQVTLIGVIGAIVALFGETEATTADLRRRTAACLELHFPNALARVSPTPAQRSQGCTVTRLGTTDIFGSAYRLTSAPHEMLVWIGVNVSRLIVIFWIDATGDDPARHDIGALTERLRFTLGGADAVGFHSFFEEATSPAGRRIVSVWSAANTGDNLLTDPSQRLFWAQDVAMMCESFWRTAIRHGIRLSAEEPCPL